MKKERGYSGYIEIFKFALIAIIFIFAILIVYYLSLYTEKCWKDPECFNQHLTRCKRAVYVNDAEEAIWLYEIKGETKNGCRVETTLKSIKIGEADMADAEGKTMTCYLPYGVVAVPGDDLEYCTGPLKEELQEIIIKKVYEHILENLGEIKEELTKAI